MPSARTGASVLLGGGGPPRPSFFAGSALLRTVPRLPFRVPARLDAALPLLMACFVLSPKFPVAGIPIRGDDLALAALLVLAAGRPARPRLAAGRAADPSVMVWILAGLASLAAGALQGTLPPGAVPVLTLVKSLQYLAGFGLARALGWPLASAVRCAWRWAGWVALAALAEGTLLLALGGDLRRERIFGNALFPDQTNHLAGFLALGAVLGLGLWPRGAGRRAVLGWMAREALIVAGLMATCSRGALLACAAGSLCAAIWGAGRRAIPWLLAGCVAGLVVAGSLRGGILAEWRVYLRSEALAEAGQSRIGDAERNRLEVWASLLPDIRRYPVLGTGPGSRNRVYYESQLMMTVAETGLVGLACLGGVLLALARAAARREDALGWALLGALVCVLTQGLVAETLIITRIAGPFWLVFGALVGEDGGMPGPAAA